MGAYGAYGAYRSWRRSPCDRIFAYLRLWKDGEGWRRMCLVGRNGRFGGVCHAVGSFEAFYEMSAAPRRC